ncbi:response regulator transcription factor [bacterium]|nr:response regulator transcription factor [bacterium]
MQSLQAKILVVDDAVDHQLIVRETLGKQHTLFQALTLAEADKELSAGTFDLILLDVNLPDGDGFTYYAKLRTQDHTRDIPVMFATSRSDISSEVMGFSLGATDFIVKPVEFARLRARIEARLKLILDQNERELTLQKGDLRLSVSLQRAALVKEGKESRLDLTPLEFKILFHFLRYEEVVFSREQLLSAIWGNATDVFDRTVDMHISNLRKKIALSDYKIQAVHGTGYKLVRKVIGK